MLILPEGTAQPAGAAGREVAVGEGVGTGRSASPWSHTLRRPATKQKTETIKKAAIRGRLCIIGLYVSALNDKGRPRIVLWAPEDGNEGSAGLEGQAPK